MRSPPCIYAKVRPVPYLLPPASFAGTDPGRKEIKLVNNKNNQEIKRLLVDNSLKEEE